MSPLPSSPRRKRRPTIPTSSLLAPSGRHARTFKIPPSREKAEMARGRLRCRPGAGRGQGGRGAPTLRYIRTQAHSVPTIHAHALPLSPSTSVSPFCIVCVCECKHACSSLERREGLIVRYVRPSVQSATSPTPMQRSGEGENDAEAATAGDGKSCHSQGRG